MNGERRPPGLIGIHVLGPGYGESIVLDLPDGTVGVIDLFRSPRGSIPTLEFLRQRRPGLTSVRFLAVTHPHADHCQGLSDFVEMFEPEEFFVFDTFQDQKLFEFFIAMRKYRVRDAVEEALSLRPGTVAHQLAIFDRYLRRNVVKQHPSRIKLLRYPRIRKICGGQVVLRFLTPGDGTTLKYRESLHDSIKAAIDDGPSWNEGWKPVDVNHNLVSGAILVQYGKTRLLLMADGELPLWHEALESQRENDESLPEPAQLVKVAHHGSSNGYVSAFYDSMCRSGSTHAVVTPFVRQRSPLPSGAGLRSLRGHVASIFCTNRSAAAHSSGLRWGLASGASAQAYPDGMPWEWISLLTEKPELKESLAPDLGGPSSLAPGAAFPLELLPDCVENPKLLRFLHPDLKNLWITGHPPAVFDEFRVSFYFDLNGKEDRTQRYIGSGAGVLVDHR